MKVEKTSGSSDSIFADMSWETVYGQSLQSAPKTLARVAPIAVSRSSESLAYR